MKAFLKKHYVMIWILGIISLLFLAYVFTTLVIVLVKPYIQGDVIFTNPTAETVNGLDGQ